MLLGKLVAMEPVFCLLADFKSELNLMRIHAGNMECALCCFLRKLSTNILKFVVYFRFSNVDF